MAGSPSGGTAARRARLEAQRQAPPKARSAPTTPPSGGPGGRSGAGGTSRGSTRAELDPDRLAALEEERDFLLGSLEDLEREHDAGDIDEDDYLELKDDYTARAAAVLRAIEDRSVAMADVRAGRRWTRNRRNWVIAGIVVVLAVVVGIGVAQSSGRRAPGGSLSGDIRQSSRDKLLEAQQFIGEGNTALQEGRGQDAVDAFRSAMDRYDEVIASSPTNAEALTYRGWLFHLLATMADGTQASDLDARAAADLDAAIAADAGYPDAHVFRAILYRNAGESAKALAELDQVQPSDIPPFMTQMVDGLRSSLSGGAGSTTTSTAASTR